MSEVDKENLSPLGIMLPIEVHVPDAIHNQYVDNLIVQPGKRELSLFFFETHIPPFAGTAEETKEYLLKKGPVRFECVSKLIVAPQLVPDLIKALQEGLNNYNASKEMEEREANK